MVHIAACRDQFFKTKLCPHLHSNSCRKGVNCYYAHSKEELKSTPDLRKTRLCEIFQKKGSCPNEDKCFFAHCEKELRYTDKYLKTDLCKYWSFGHCEAGSLCRHAHGVDELRPRKFAEEEIEHLASGDNIHNLLLLRKAKSGEHTNRIIDSETPNIIRKIAESEMQRERGKTKQRHVNVADKAALKKVGAACRMEEKNARGILDQYDTSVKRLLPAQLSEAPYKAESKNVTYNCVYPKVAPLMKGFYYDAKSNDMSVAGDFSCPNPYLQYMVNTYPHTYTNSAVLPAGIYPYPFPVAPSAPPISYISCSEKSNMQGSVHSYWSPPHPAGESALLATPAHPGMMQYNGNLSFDPPPYLSYPYPPYAAPMSFCMNREQHQAPKRSEGTPVQLMHMNDPSCLPTPQPTPIDCSAVRSEAYETEQVHEIRAPSSSEAFKEEMQQRAPMKMHQQQEKQQVMHPAGGANKHDYEKMLNRIGGAMYSKSGEVQDNELECKAIMHETEWNPMKTCTQEVGVENDEEVMGERTTIGLFTEQTDLELMNNEETFHHEIINSCEHVTGHQEVLNEDANVTKGRKDETMLKLVNQKFSEGLENFMMLDVYCD